MKSKLKNLFFFSIGFLFVSCKYMSKEIRHANIDVAFFTQNELCNGGKLSEKGKEIFKPFLINDMIFKPQGEIYQLSLESLGSLSISDSSYSALTNWRSKMLKKDTYDATLANYNSMIDDFSTENLCNTNVSTKVAENLNTLLASNSNSKVIVLSTTILDTVWNNYKVFKEVSKLKDYVILLTKGEGSDKILVLIEPEQKTSPPPEVQLDGPNDTSKVSIPPGAVSGVEGIRQALLNIIKIEDPVKRRALANRLLLDSFTNQFYVTMRREKISAEPEKWDYNEGKDYIFKRLTSEESIKDLEIKKVERKSADKNKISYLELIEYHNQ